MKSRLHQAGRCIAWAFFISIAHVAMATAAPGEIYIEFMARPTSPVTQLTPGHIFFCISLHLNNGPKEDCFGFYPKSDLKAFDGPGTISNEFKKSAIQNVSISLTHKIDESTRLSIYSVVSKWAGSDYKLLVNNCKDFVSAVSAAAGLKVPPPSATVVPTDFLAQLKSLYWTGKWTSSDPNARFVLEITKEGSVTWHEKGPETGKEVTKTVSLTLTPTGAEIKRENSSDVLQELGYQPTIIPQIISSSPKPSFMQLQRVGSALTGDWNGIVVTKDAKGHFQRLDQPGSRPAKRFDFTRVSGS